MTQLRLPQQSMDLLDALAAQGVAHAHVATPRQLASLLGGLARMGYAPGSALLGAAADAAARDLQGLGAEGISEVREAAAAGGGGGAAAAVAAVAAVAAAAAAAVAAAAAGCRHG